MIVMQRARTMFILAGLFLFYFSTFIQSATPMAPKTADLEVTEMTLVRKAGFVEVDTTVKNLNLKPLRGLTAVYHFFSINHEPVTAQRTTIDEGDLAPGAESTIHAQLEEPARAVTVEFSAVDGKGKELRVKNAGPFRIE